MTKFISDQKKCRKLKVDPTLKRERALHSYSTVSDSIYYFFMFSAKFLIVRVVLENQYSFLQSESFN